VKDVLAKKDEELKLERKRISDLDKHCKDLERSNTDLRKLNSDLEERHSKHVHMLKKSHDRDILILIKQIYPSLDKPDVDEVKSEQGEEEAKENRRKIIHIKSELPDEMEEEEEMPDSSFSG